MTIIHMIQTGENGFQVFVFLLSEGSGNHSTNKIKMQGAEIGILR